MKPRTMILLGIAGAIAATFAGAGVVHLRSTAAWDAMDRAAAALAAERQAHDARRESLWGDPVDDRAFAHYRRSLELARERYEGIEGAQDELVSCLVRTDAELAEQTVELRERWRPVRDALRRGAHCLDRWQERPTSADDDEIVNLLAARWVCNLCVFEARALRHEGRDREAVEWTLDAAAFGADLAHRGILINQMIAIAMLGIATDAAWPDEALQQLDAEALGLLAAGLARLDERLDPCLYLGEEQAFMLRHLQDPNAEFWEGASLQAWSYGFSSRWMAADAFLQFAGYARQLAAQRGSWPARAALMARMQERCADGDNPFLAMLVPNLSAAERNLRQVVAHVRMLRIAVALHRGERLELPDPFADGPFAVVPEGDGHRIVSAGERNDKPLTRKVVTR